MNKYIFSIMIVFSTGFLHANDKTVITKKMVVTSDQDEKNVDVNAKVENDQLTLTVKSDGEENVFQVDLNDEEALEALKEELEDLDIDVNILALIGHEDEHQTMLFNDDNQNDFHFGFGRGGYLGVQIQDITDQLRDYFKVKGDGGVLISDVVNDSPAEKAGLKAGDVIIRINKVRISDAGELTRTIRGEKPETEVEINLVRKGREKSIKAILGSSSDSFSWFGDKKGLGAFHPENLKGMEDFKFHFNKDDHKQDFERLERELKELREEVEKLKNS